MKNITLLFIFFQICKVITQSNAYYFPFDSNKLVNGKQEFYFHTTTKIQTNYVSGQYSFLTVKEYNKELTCHTQQ